MFPLRAATMADVRALEELIALSVRRVSVSHYSKEQAELALATDFFGVDTELIEDQSYFLIEDGMTPVACGGWSRRKTLFGGKTSIAREEGYLNPAVDPAKIRAFFVHPDYTRQGLGKRILQHCESEAQAYGFQKLEMMATLSGARFYQSLGYTPSKEFTTYPLGEDVTIDGVRMTKEIIKIAA